MYHTLHYAVTNAVDITESEKDIMYAVSYALNSGKFAEAWKRESFWLDPYRFYLNWSHPFFHNKGKKACWETLQNEIGKRMSKGEKRNAVIQQLCRANMIQRLSPDEIYGFYEADNNYNAMLAYYGLTIISMLTKAEITLRDEGGFLLCPVLIKHGKVKPNREDIKEDWRSWQEGGFLESNLYGHTDRKARQIILLRRFLDWSAPQHFCQNVKSDGVTSSFEETYQELVKMLASNEEKTITI